MVIAAIVIIELLCLNVDSAISLEFLPISMLILLSPWLAKLKYRFIRICVLVL